MITTECNSGITIYSFNLFIHFIQSFISIKIYKKNNRITKQSINYDGGDATKGKAWKVLHHLTMRT